MIEPGKGGAYLVLFSEIGLVLGCKAGLMGDPVNYWVPLQEPLPEKLGKAIYNLGQPHR